MATKKSSSKLPDILGYLKRDARLILENYWRQILVSSSVVIVVFSLGFSLGRTTTDTIVTENYYNFDNGGPFIYSDIPPFRIPQLQSPFKVPNIIDLGVIPPVEKKVKQVKKKVKKKKNTMIGFKERYIIQPKIFEPGKSPHSLYINSFANPIELNEQARCLALNIYFESRSEPLIGKYAVGLVTLGRVEHKNYPDTICGVVWQKGYVKKTKKWVAHFSWTLDGRSDRPKNKRQWQEAQDIAIYIYHNYPDLAMDELGLPDDLLHATHYHARYVKPRWRHDFKKVAQIGLHLFYK